MMSGRAELRDGLVHHKGDLIATFSGSAEEFASLKTAAAHRLIRYLVHLQHDNNRDEVEGGHIVLAQHIGARACVMKTALEALSKLAWHRSARGPAEKLLYVERRRQRRNHILRIELRGPLASAYLCGDSIATTHGRRVTPIPYTPPPTSCPDLAAAELSFHLLMLKELREVGFRDDEAAKDELWIKLPFERERRDELARAANLDPLKAERVLQLWCQERGGWLLADTPESDGRFGGTLYLPEWDDRELSAYLADGFRMTERGRKSRRQRLRAGGSGSRRAKRSRA